MHIFSKAKWKSLQVFLVLLPVRNSSNLIHKRIAFLLLNSFVQASLLWKSLAAVRHRLILLIRCESKKICKFLSHRKEASVAFHHFCQEKMSRFSYFRCNFRPLTVPRRSPSPTTPTLSPGTATGTIPVFSWDLGNFQPYSNLLLLMGCITTGCSVRELNKLLIWQNSADTLWEKGVTKERASYSPHHTALKALGSWGPKLQTLLQQLQTSRDCIVPTAWLCHHINKGL